MSILNYPLWTNIGKKLKEDLYPKRYITPERYVPTDDNPLEPLVALPDIEEFFGTKVLNLFIVAVPYGWVKIVDWIEVWPPAGYEEAIERHIRTFDKYNKYKTFVFMDYNIVNKMVAKDPATKFKDMMDATKSHLQQLCNTTLADYGFKMENDITEEKQPEFFKKYIDEFYGIAPL